MPASERTGPAWPFPPTLLFVVAFGVGLWLHDRTPVRVFSGDRAFRIALGAAGMAGGGLLFWWGLRTFLRVRTGIMPYRPARTLVTFGPYQWSRNPQYLAFVLGYVGLSLVVNAAWPIFLLPMAIVLLVLLVIRSEERYMRAVFGREYDTYCRRVNRWL